MAHNLQFRTWFVWGLVGETDPLGREEREFRMKFNHIVSIVAASVCLVGNAFAATTGSIGGSSIQRQHRAAAGPVQVCATEGKIAGNADKESTVNEASAKCDGGAFRIQTAQEAADILRDRSNSM